MGSLRLEKVATNIEWQDVRFETIPHSVVEGRIRRSALEGVEKTVAMRKFVVMG
jgi:hypothetical protein